MAEKMIHVEVGRRLVKVCTVASKGKSGVIKQGFMFNTPPDCVNDGDIVDPTTLAAALNQSLMDNGVRNAKSVTFTLVSGRTATRDVQIPPIKPNRVKALIEANASEYLPVDVSRYKFTYGMLYTAKEEEGVKSNLQVIAAPLQILDGYAKVAEAAGLRLHAIDFIGNSQFQVMKSLKTQKSTNVVMCVNVGDSSTYVTFSKGERMLLQRVLPFGGDDLISEFLEKTGTFDYVAALKICSVPLLSLEAATGGVLTEADANASLSRLASGIVRTLDFFNSGKWKEPLDSVVLAGTCAHISGLREAVTDATESDRKGRIYYLEGQYGAVSMGDPALVAQYISCFGSALSPVDLIPDKYKVATGLMMKSVSSEDAKLTFGISVIAACLVIGLGLSGWSVFGYFLAESDKTKLENEIKDLQKVEEVYEKYKASDERLRIFAEMDSSLDTPNMHLASFLVEDLERYMPQDMHLLSATFSTTGIQLNVVVGTYEQAAQAIINFRDFDSIDRDTVEVQSIERSIDEGVVKVSFSLRAGYKPFIGGEYISPDGSVPVAADDSSDDSDD
jgi:type IV pilus assembly protein PilM